VATFLVAFSRGAAAVHSLHTARVIVHAYAHTTNVLIHCLLNERNSSISDNKYKNYLFVLVIWLVKEN